MKFKFTKLFLSLFVCFSLILQSNVIKCNAQSCTESFIEEIGEDCRKIAGDNDLYASVMIAQAIIESASGTSGLAKSPNFNIFGRKGSYNGNSIKLKTKEYDKKKKKYKEIEAKFKRYPSYKEAMEDYADLLVTRCPGATKSRKSSPYDVGYYLQGNYASDKDYGSSIKATIITYDLTRFDITCEELEIIEDEKENREKSIKEKKDNIEEKKIDDIIKLNNSMKNEDIPEYEEDFDPSKEKLNMIQDQYDKVFHKTEENDIIKDDLLSVFDYQNSELAFRLKKHPKIYVLK